MSVKREFIHDTFVINTGTRIDGVIRAVNLQIHYDLVYAEFCVQIRM